MTTLEKLGKDLCREFWDARYPNNKTIAKKEFEYRRKEWMSLAEHVIKLELETRKDENEKLIRALIVADYVDKRIAELERQMKGVRK
ncbi:hypothetical protein [Sulfuricurvum sp.]|uniref:hypothetical protein n=1 Tax=Sulfuricurvum sp. TaxID=2025608 RepID=UPI003567B4F3